MRSSLPQQGHTAQQQWTLWHNRSRSEQRQTEPEWWSGSSLATMGSYQYNKIMMVYIQKGQQIIRDQDQDVPNLEIQLKRL